MSQDKSPKETIGVKVPSDWKAKIKELADEMGITPSEWLQNLIGQELGISDVGTVRSLAERVSTLEKKLNRLAS